MNLNSYNGYSCLVDEIALTERALSFKKRSIKKESKLKALRLAVSMIDLTTLEGQDTEGKVRNLCRKAKFPHPGYDIPSTAAVCVYPNLVGVAKNELGESGVKVAAVATGFPSGQTPLSTRLEEVKFAVEQGADEIDMVISRGAYHQGNLDLISEEIRLTKEACGNAKLKVILETGELAKFNHVRLLSFLAMEAGADFIKTSTGKVAVNATMPVSLVMLESIRDYYYKTGQKIGFKPAGGIRTAKDAVHYLCMVYETLGDDWMNNDMFRYGASSLLNDLLKQIVKQLDGNYQSDIYFSQD